MSRPAGRARRGRRTQILIFAENLNDSRAIKELVHRHNPGLEATLRPVNDPPSLTRHAGVQARQSWVSRVQKSVRAAEASGTEVRCVLIHQDSDGSDAGPAAEAQITTDFRVVNGIPVVPVTMPEAWWLLFPEALTSVRNSWRGALPSKPRSVEGIADPKHELRRATRKASGRHEYQELDSPAIAEKIRELGLEPLGHSPSYDRFVTRARAL